MRVVIICKDKPGSLDIRKATRDAHLDYIDKTGVVEMAGPLLDDAGEMHGSLIVLSVHDMRVAQDWAENDPYAKAELFQSVEVVQWNKVIG